MQSSRTRLAAGAVNCLQSRSVANRARERDTELTGRLRTQKVIKFLVNCGEPNLQNLLVPSRLEATLAVLDTDRDGHIDAVEWEACIESALANKLAERAARRELQAKAAQKEIEEFTAEFKSAARRCFQLIDKDGGGTLSHDEIVTAVKTDQEVISFLKTCGEENLMFLLHPPRLKKALEALDADGSGEIDVEEWETAINKGLAKRLEQLAIERERRERAALRDDAEFSTEFLNAARRCFEMIDKDESGTLEKEEIVRAVRADQVANAASYNRANFNLRGLCDLRNCCFRVFGVWWCRNNRTTASRFVSTAGSD